MSIWNKILLGLIFVASLAFFHAAPGRSRPISIGPSKADNFETEVGRKSAPRSSVCGRPITSIPSRTRPSACSSCASIWARAGEPRPDLDEVREAKGRHRPPTGIMNVTVGTDESNTFAKNMLLYAFEEGDDQSPGKYLGEFRVEQRQREAGRAGQHHADAQVARSARSKSLADNVMESKDPWVLYEMMPTDEHEAFRELAGRSKKWVPDEFLKDGQLIERYGQADARIPATRSSSGRSAITWRFSGPARCIARCSPTAWNRPFGT